MKNMTLANIAQAVGGTLDAKMLPEDGFVGTYTSAECRSRLAAGGAGRDLYRNARRACGWTQFYRSSV